MDFTLVLSLKTGVFIRGRTGTHRRRSYEDKAEIGVMWPQAKGHLEPPGARRGRKDPPQCFQRERGPGKT